MGEGRPLSLKVNCKSDLENGTTHQSQPFPPLEPALQISTSASQTLTITWESC